MYHQTAFEFLATEGNVRATLLHIRQKLSEWGLEQDYCGTVELILAEALNNIAEHAYAGKAHPGSGSIMLQQGPDRLYCGVHDQGTALPGLKLPKKRQPNHDVPLEDLPEGKFGWYLIHTLTENLCYNRINGENRLTFDIPINSIQI